MKSDRRYFFFFILVVMMKPEAGEVLTTFKIHRKVKKKIKSISVLYMPSTKQTQSISRCEPLKNQ